MYTVITKGNKVNLVHIATYGGIDDIIIVNESGNVLLTKGNPITWPTAATNGLRAIVDVKAGTLRFGMNNELIGLTEYVVSEYVAPAPVHVLNLIKEWPKSMPPQRELERVDGHKWEYFHGKWVLSSNLSDREYHEGHWLNYHENKKKYADVAQPAITAASMLTAALGHMEDRAKTYDAPGGERSMGKTVAAFNTITGLALTEEQGWLFMEILKQVRSQQGNYRADNYEDMVAYAALRGECAARERGNKS